MIYFIVLPCPQDLLVVSATQHFLAKNPFLKVNRLLLEVYCIIFLSYTTDNSAEHDIPRLKRQKTLEMPDVIEMHVC